MGRGLKKATLREFCVILDGSHRKWCFATLALFLLATTGYALYALSSPGGPRGGSVVGMLYGIAGSALMIFAGLISLRKKVPTWPIGSAQTWLRGHIWLGLLSAALIVFHAAFRWGGPLEQVLLAVMAAVILSGLIDLGVQQLFPRQMTARVPLETFYAQIPYECRLLQLEGDVAVSKVCGPLPLEGDESVATTSRLKLLGVTGRQPLPAVYRLAESQNGRATESAGPHAAKATTKASSPAVSSEPASAEEEKLLSAAAKIAAMRAAKAAGATATAEKPSPSASSQGEVAEKPAAAKMTAAEKIAAMRAAKAGGATATAEKPSPNEGSQSEVAEKPAAAKMTAAEKIAAMRAAKAGGAASSKPAAAEPTTAEAAEKAPAAKLTAAEKIAMMRSLKHTSKPEASEPPAEAASEAADAAAAPAAQGKLTAAEKIALMRAGKKPTAEPPASAEAARPAVDSPPAQPATTDAAKKPLSAAEKIAMMRAKSQPAAATAEKAETAAPAAAAKPAPKKPAAAAAAKKPAADKPADPAAQKQAAEALEKFYLESVRPFLAYESRSRGALASEVNAGGIFAVVGAGLPEDLRPVLDRLLGLCDKRRQLSVQERVHGAMHFWLFIHVPLSLALLGLGVAHAIMSVYY